MSGDIATFTIEIAEKKKNLARVSGDHQTKGIVMVQRAFAMSLALVSALSLGFSLPAHAENHASARKPAQESAEQTKIEKLKTDLAEKLKKVKIEGLKLYQQAGSELSIDEFVSNPSAFKDGVTIGFGDHRFLFRGELISEGEKGIKIFITHSVAGAESLSTGQVITISPEMTKRAIQQRFEDAIESIMIAVKSASATKGEANRQVASISFGNCLFMLGFGFLTLAAVAHIPTKGTPAVEAAMVGAIFAGIAANSCIGR